MKIYAACAAVLLFASHTFAASTGITLVQKNPPESKPIEVKPADPQPAPPAPAKPAPKKEEAPKEPVIPGMTIARPNGTFLGLEVVGAKFKVSFYDKKKKPMTPDMVSGLIRWPNVRGSGDNRSPLSVSGMALISAKPALPPFNYNVFITLLSSEAVDAKSENYAVMYRG